SQIVAYWSLTILVVAEAVAGGFSDLLRLEYVVRIMAHLGYPDYVAYILGTWKLLGAVAVLTPRYPRLQEGAYAGMMFNYTGAVASHFGGSVGGGVVIPPFIFACMVAGSGPLRPPARRLSSS